MCVFSHVYNRIMEQSRFSSNRELVNCVRKGGGKGEGGQQAPFAPYQCTTLTQSPSLRLPWKPASFARCRRSFARALSFLGTPTPDE